MKNSSQTKKNASRNALTPRQKKRTPRRSTSRGVRNGARRLRGGVFPTAESLAISRQKTEEQLQRLRNNQDEYVRRRAEAATFLETARKERSEMHDRLVAARQRRNDRESQKNVENAYEMALKSQAASDKVQAEQAQLFLASQKLKAHQLRMAEAAARLEALRNPDERAAAAEYLRLVDAQVDASSI
jgi:chromosome segregation ATPase